MVEKMSSDLGQNSRASNALMKRNESIQKWKASETAREKPVRLPDQFRIKFNKGICLLSAVASGDLEEATSLLDEGVDINYTNVDGLTSLHQACIDENEDMVNLLIDRDADIEARDNEGWTPLHAAASAGNVDIAQILCDNSADLAAVNNEGEVPIDLAEEEEMEDFLTDEIEKRDLEMEEARNEEERVMLEDIASYMDLEKIDENLDWQGATALHVAAAKGYNKVISMLLQIRGIDVNVQDNDGWTPVHAAVHWGSKTACELLTDAGGDFEIRNSNGQAPYELAEKDFLKTVEQCRKKSKDILKNKVTPADPGSLMLSAQRAITLLKQQPPRSSVKGSRDKFDSDKSKIINDNNVANDLDSGTESVSGESDQDSDTEDKQTTQPKETITANIKRTSAPGEPAIKITQSTTSRLQGSALTNRTKKEEPKPEPYTTSQPTASSRFTSRFARKEEEETKKEEEPRSRFTPQTRTFSVGSRISQPEPKAEEKKDDNPISRYTSLRQSAKDEKVDDARTKIRPGSKSEEDEIDTRSRKKEDTGTSTTSSIAERLKKKNEELMSANNDRGSERPSDSLASRTTSAPDRYTLNRDRDTTRDNRDTIRDRDTNRDSRDTTNRDSRDTTNRDSRDTNRDSRDTNRDSRDTNRDNNRDIRDTLSSTSSIGPGRSWGIGSTTSSDTSTGDTRDIQRELDQTLKEVQEYKQKYERALKEKEELEKKMEQFKEDIEKMQELKNDNLRLKDENGALIRVISKLSRTPAS